MATLERTGAWAYFQCWRTATPLVECSFGCYLSTCCFLLFVCWLIGGTGGGGLWMRERSNEQLLSTSTATYLWHHGCCSFSNASSDTWPIDFTYVNFYYSYCWFPDVPDNEVQIRYCARLHCSSSTVLLSTVLSFPTVNDGTSYSPVLVYDITTVLFRLMFQEPCLILSTIVIMMMKLAHHSSRTS